MMNQKYLLLISVFLITSSFAQAAVLTSGVSKAGSSAPNEAQLLEELTGKKATVAASSQTTKPVVVAPPKVTQAPSELHLNAGYQAYMKKDYILALKHYNTVLAKYPHSNEVRLTYMAKAKLYNEMGLVEPAQRNFKLAQQMAASNKQTK